MDKTLMLNFIAKENKPLLNLLYPPSTNPSCQLIRQGIPLLHAKEFVVLVTPHTNQEGWDKLKTAINDAAKRGVDVYYYATNGEGLKVQKN